MRPRMLPPTTVSAIVMGVALLPWHSKARLAVSLVVRIKWVTGEERETCNAMQSFGSC